MDEFSLIASITGKNNRPEIIVDNGDDAAVLNVGGELLAISSDTIVNGDHFNLDYFKPYDVGIKAIESSASDIVAMGGHPKYLFISLVLTKPLQESLVSEMYQGMHDAAKRIGAVILGGDTTHGTQLVISVTVVGKIPSQCALCTRSSAKPGDLIYVTGELGASTAGLKLFLANIKGHEYVKNKHLNPSCRIDLVDLIAPYANAMIDISDGLSSELHHICRLSNVGACIDRSKVPIKAETIAAAAALVGDKESHACAINYAYSGGEDFELLYTIPKELSSHALGHKIGEITNEKEILEIDMNGCTVSLPNTGYNHF